MKRLTLILSLFCFGFTSLASTTKVGNGDDGRDLEGLTEITSGIIFLTRDEAVKRLETLNIQGVQGLGSLIPELKNTKMYMAKADVSPIENEGESCPNIFPFPQLKGTTL